MCLELLMKIIDDCIQNKKEENCSEKYVEMIEENL